MFLSSCLAVHVQPDGFDCSVNPQIFIAKVLGQCDFTDEGNIFAFVHQLFTGLRKPLESTTLSVFARFPSSDLWCEKGMNFVKNLRFSDPPESGMYGRLKKFFCFLSVGWKLSIKTRFKRLRRLFPRFEYGWRFRLKKWTLCRRQFYLFLPL